VRAHEVDLITLIQGAKQFQIPLYQRVLLVEEAAIDPPPAVILLSDSVGSGRRTGLHR
jgi:hypothetical protein